MKSTTFIKKYIKLALLNYFIENMPVYKVSGKIDRKLGICSLLCHRYVDYFILCLTSFFYYSKTTLPIYIVSDGSLTEQDIKKLKAHFTIEIELHPGKKLKTVLAKKYSHTYSYRFDEKNSDYKKKFDVYLLNPFDTFLYIDSDLLFYKSPDLIKQYLENPNSGYFYMARENNNHKKFPGIMETQFFVRKFLNRYYNRQEIGPFFNGGLMFLSKEIINLDKIEELITLMYDIEFEDNFGTEEIVMSVLQPLSTTIRLPTKNYVMTSIGPEYQCIDWDKCVCVHYSGDQGLKLRFITDALKLIFTTHNFSIKL